MNMVLWLALVIGAAVGVALAFQLKLTKPQNLVIAGVVGGVAGVLANALLSGLLSAILVLIGQIALVVAGAGAAVWGLKQVNVLKEDT
jgi:hypothetical protein